MNLYDLLQSNPNLNVTINSGQLIDVIDKSISKAISETCQLLHENSSIEKDRWLNIDELQEYLPDHPAKATIYGWVSSRQIPYHKNGKKLRFLQKEIDEYLMKGKRKTVKELMFESAKTSRNK